MVASPGGDAIGRHLLKSSRLKPIAELSRAECYAHGYDCTSCSGEIDSVTTRAEQCLANVLDKDPNDARAWALQSTIYAHQFGWGSTLKEPERSDISARKHLPMLAVNAANKAEQLSDGADSAVYWGMAQAYGATCQIEKLRTAIDRGLQINPDDPNLLGAFGNWIAYTGNWDEGAKLINRALEIEPRHYKRYWLFGLAKSHYARGEYQQAYDLFVKAFNERNWLSHLQLAYTLPYLGRHDEARQALNSLDRVAPGTTLEKVLEFYKSYCFPDDYLQKIKEALVSVGLPSRGESSDFDNIEPPKAKVLQLDGQKVEYMDLGEGTPVVFVHGAMSDYRTWSYLQNPVSDRYRYISYSRRYFGSQPWTDKGEKYNNDQAADDLVRFIDELELGPVFLITWSSGAGPANIVAAMRPDMVQGIVHYEPVADEITADDEQIHVARDSFYAGFKRQDDLLLQGDIEQATKAFLETVFEKRAGDFEGEVTALQKVILDNARTVPLGLLPKNENRTEFTCEFVANIKVPALIIHGSRTNEYWSFMARKFRDCMPGATLAIIDGVNHDGPIRKPNELFALIDSFIKQHQF